jgi:hypothetical protein
MLECPEHKMGRSQPGFYKNTIKDRPLLLLKEDCKAGPQKPGAQG